MARKKQPNKAERILGKKIERLRLMKQVSRMQLGRKINETEQQIAKYESGEFIPLTVLEAIAEALGEPIQKKYIRRISFLRKLEIETQIEQEELSDLYQEILPDNTDE
jgi:transcriptional regulator with XRE-family HTH domain